MSVVVIDEGRVKLKDSEKNMLHGRCVTHPVDAQSAGWMEPWGGGDLDFKKFQTAGSGYIACHIET